MTGKQLIWLIVAATVILGLVVIIAGIVADARDPERRQLAVAVRPTATTPPTVASATVRPRPTRRPTAMPQPKIGQDVDVGPIRYNVLAVTDLGSKLESSNPLIPKVETAGRFLLVDLGVVNRGDSDKALTDGDLPLVDRQDRTYRASADFNVKLHIPPDVEWCAIQLQPGVPKRCVVIYEVPKDSGRLRLKLTSLALFGDETLIGLWR